MLQILLSRLGWFALLLLLQVLVFNHIHILGYATPMPYVYFLVLLPSNTPRWLYVLSGFLLGLLVDIFSNTPGMAACSLCLAGLLAPAFLKVFGSADLDEDESFEPGADTIEWGGFVRYAGSLALLHCLAFFALETFSFFDLRHILINVSASAFLTLLFVVAFEVIRGNGRKKRGKR